MTAPQQSTPPPLLRLVIICLTVIVCVLCAIAGGLVAAGKSIGDLLTVVGIVAAPVVLGLLAYVSSTLTAGLSHVKEQTNGNITSLQQSVMELARTLAVAPAVSASAVQSAQQPSPTTPPAQAAKEEAA